MSATSRQSNPGTAPAGGESFMAHGWYYKIGDEQFGPVRFDTLVDFANNGRIARDNLVREGERGRWQPAGDVYGLFPSPADWNDLLAAIQPAFLHAAPKPASEVDHPPAALPHPAPATSHNLHQPHVPASAQAPVPSQTAAEPTPQPSEPQSEVEIWFARVLGHQLGPMSQADLLRMAASGELDDSDEVRLGTDGDWVPAESVPLLLADMVLGKARRHQARQSTDEGDFELDLPLAPSAASPAPGGPSRPAAGTPPEAVSDADSPLPRVSAPPMPTAPTPIPPSITKPQQHVASPGLRVRSTHRRTPARTKLVVGLAAVVIAGALAAALAFTEPERTYYATLDGVWSELRTLRARGASQDEWDRFTTDARRKIDPIVRKLRKTAHANAPARQHLLWAAEDYLLPMLDDARHSPSDSERRFAEHLAEARRWLGD